MNLYEFIKWWWENNIEWIRIHDPWVIPFTLIAIVSPYIAKAITILLPKITRTIAVLLRFFRKK